jgi:ribosomal protein S5
MTARRFRYTWFRTWDDRPHDFSAKDGDLPIGRVYRLAGVGERWKWAMTVRIGNRLGSSGGILGTRDEACDAVESAYEAMKARIPIRDRE